MGLRTIPIRRIGNRANLVLGGDRELVLTSALLSGVLAFAAQQWIAVVFATVLWFGSLHVLRRMGKNDPRMRHVYLRHMLYSDYYAARSTPFRRNSKLQGKRYR